MPMNPQEFYAHAMRHADAEGRLSLSRMTGWDVFPFEQASLRTVPLERPVLPEPARAGEDPADCAVCAASGASAGRVPVWSDEHWRLSALESSGAPLILMLEPQAHHDLPDLPDELASEMGLLITRIARAIEALPHIARAHVSRWGDGGAHLHIFFFARPAGFAQLRGTCLAIWDDLLPAVPDDQPDRDAAEVGQALARSHGGQAYPAPELRYDLERNAVRVVLADVSGRVLLFHVLTPDEAPDGWWELPGGGIDPGESYLEAAVREIREETGLVLDPAQVAAPAWRRDTTWRSRGKRRLQHEVVVLARVAADQPAIVDGGRTPEEIEDYVTARWWPVPEITRSRERFYPSRLPELLPRFLAGEDIDEPFERWN